VPWAGVAKALLARRPDRNFVGVGGQRMRAAGVDLLADFASGAVMGFTEIITHLPRHVALLRSVTTRLRDVRVALLGCVDYPGFNLNLAAEAHAARTPLLIRVIGTSVVSFKVGTTRVARRAGAADRALSRSQHLGHTRSPRRATVVWNGRRIRPAKVVQALAGRSFEKHPPRSSTHIPWRSTHNANRHRKVVQRRQGVWFHHP